VKLDNEGKRQFAIRVYDLINYENLNYTKVYVEAVKKIFKQDKMEWGLEATKAVIFYLHKVMAIKDEVYVAHLLLAPEKFKRDFERYQIDPQRGDRVIYNHINRPEFNIWGLKICFDIKTQNWMLAVMKHLKFLRRLLPQWHAREKDFRRWYLELVKNFRYEDYKTYLGFVEALKCPEEVRGYREIRYPKMQAAQQKVKDILDKNFPAIAREIYPEASPARFYSKS
jgi:indolepyruvate ferredoxin oxidoreductase